ncbi:hypothetical protein VRB50_20755 [Pseudomonas poae]|uniref:hypothetical protein n=1 Tax=Pseudomonas poae TaxID=200451 RepID=UPI0030CAE1CB
MNTKESEKVKAAARAKLRKIQQSTGYRSFLMTRQLRRLVALRPPRLLAGL